MRETGSKSKRSSDYIREPTASSRLPPSLSRLRKCPEPTNTFKKLKTKIDDLDDQHFQPPARVRIGKDPFFKPNASKEPESFSKPLEITDPNDNSEKADSDFRGTTTKFKLPTRRVRDDNNKLASNAFKSFAQATKENESNDKKEKCPYCSEILFPLTYNIKKALSQIRDEDRHYELKQTKDMEGELKPINKRTVSNKAKDAFCKLHKLELIIKPLGLKKGYPTEINFDELEKRIQRFDDELKILIQNKCKSDFRKVAEDAYRILGKNKARSTTSLMVRFEECLPGYYGPKGSSLILGILVKLYMESGYLDRELVSPQLPLEFLQQVLVPEVGYRLIRQDLFRKNKSAAVMPGMNEKVKEIMEESREYGAAMFPVEDQKIDEVDAVLVDSDDDSNNITISSSEDESD